MNRFRYLNIQCSYSISVTFAITTARPLLHSISLMAAFCVGIEIEAFVLMPFAFVACAHLARYFKARDSVFVLTRFECKSSPYLNFIMRDNSFTFLFVSFSYCSKQSSSHK